MLGEILSSKEPQIISLIGGGGKTTAMGRLAQELVAAGEQVIVTTTTKLARAEAEAYPHRLLLAETATGPAGKLGPLPAVDLLALGGAVTADKWLGITPGQVEAIHTEPGQGRFLLVEADGAARKPFKAPDAHEPVIPAATKLVIGVMGAWALGQTIEEANMHRPSLVAALAGLAPGAILTPAAAARVILHSQGYQKQRPAHAAFVMLINGVDDANEAAARQLGRYLREAGIKKVLLTNLREETALVGVLP